MPRPLASTNDDSDPAERRPCCSLGQLHSSPSAASPRRGIACTSSASCLCSRTLSCRHDAAPRDPPPWPGQLAPNRHATCTTDVCGGRPLWPAATCSHIPAWSCCRVDHQTFLMQSHGNLQCKKPLQFPARASNRMDVLVRRGGIYQTKPAPARPSTNFFLATTNTSRRRCSQAGSLGLLQTDAPVARFLAWIASAVCHGSQIASTTASTASIRTASMWASSPPFASSYCLDALASLQLLLTFG
jgi:hypothetical protein